MIKNIIQRGFNLLGIGITYLPFNKYKRILKKEGFTKKQYRIFKDTIFFTIYKKEFFIPKYKIKKLKYGLRYLRDILKLDGSNIFTSLNEIILEIENIKIIINNAEELFIIKEIFVDKIYNVNINDPCVVIDVGMNVGIATLFFANFDNVKKVYSFEPFLSTLEMGIKNFQLNETLKEKIYYYGFGLSDRDKNSIFDYSEDFKGSSGVFGIPDYLPGSKTLKIEPVQVELKAASKIVSNILKENVNLKIILKLDCEGSEYDIITDLQKMNLLSQIDISIIEWHKLGPKLISDILKKNKFYSLILGSESNNTGFIYAFRYK